MAISITTRYAAFATHLAISILILLVMLAVIFFYWFPAELIYAGGIEGLKILIGVDLVLGPVLTLIVFDRAKKSLKFDLTMIGVLQISCLLAGLWLIYNERPIAQVIADDGVHLHASARFKAYEVEPIEWPGRTPYYIYLELPSDASEVQSLAITSEFIDGTPLSLRTDLFQSMETVSEAQFKARVELIRTISGADLTSTLDALPQRADCHWLPVISIHVDGFACTSYRNGVVELSDKKIF
ncbi:MAG: hypothetical protein HKN50_03380 [Gammaproteobacteria bacterium]|nr:hypothetical protein [Gammaproteobacteria bacterium]